MPKKVVVVGAGVLGLTSALELLQHGYDVSIIGRTIPGETDAYYASPYAGANWFSFGNPDEHFLNNIDKASYIKFLEFARSEPRAATHVVKLRTYARLDELKDGNVVEPWYKNFVKNYRVLSKDDIPAGFDEDIVTGYEFDTVTVTTGLYLHYLLQEIFKLGGTLKRKTIRHIREAYNQHHTGSKADVVVNSTGLLAKTLGGVEDGKVYPIRGQIVRVRNNFPSQVVVSIPGYANEDFYAFPRKEGGGIIGGCFLPDNWSTVVDPELSKRILERAKKYIPELTDPMFGNGPEIDVIEDYAALRPGRRGGVRIEREGSIIHNYGIGGAGYQASFGLANEVVRLTEEYFRKSKL